jgi:hypothetical protein
VTGVVGADDGSAVNARGAVDVGIVDGASEGTVNDALLGDRLAEGANDAYSVGDSDEDSVGNSDNAVLGIKLGF